MSHSLWNAPSHTSESVMPSAPNSLASRLGEGGARGGLSPHTGVIQPLPRAHGYWECFACALTTVCTYRQGFYGRSAKMHGAARGAPWGMTMAFHTASKVLWRCGSSPLEKIMPTLRGGRVPIIYLGGGGVYSGTGSLGRICFAQAGVCVKVTSKRIRHRTLCCIPKAVSRRVRLD